jgi:hypothetical protein
MILADSPFKPSVLQVMETLSPMTILLQVTIIFDVTYCCNLLAGLPDIAFVLYHLFSTQQTV